MNRKYFYMEPYIFAVVKKQELLCYDTLTGCSLKKCLDGEKALGFVSRLIENNPSRIIEIQPNDFVDKETQKIIDELRENFMGDTHEGNKPFLTPFTCKIGNDKENMRLEIGKVGKLVKQLNIVLGHSTNCQSDLLRQTGIKQFLFPYGDVGDKYIDSSVVEFFLSTSAFELNQIMIIGDVYRYKSLNNIISLVPDINIGYVFYYLDFCDSGLPIFNNKTTFSAMVDFPIDINALKNMLGVFQKQEICLSLQFVATNEKDVEIANDLDLDQYNNLNCQIIPFFDGENIDFFKNNVFIEEMDILEQIQAQETVFMKMNVNSAFFGKLYLMPDNQIYTHPGNVPLCSIADYKKTLYKAILDDDTWFKIRDKEPCIDCVYQYICPSISGYELAIGKPNLCNLKPY